MRLGVALHTAAAHSSRSKKCDIITAAHGLTGLALPYAIYLDIMRASFPDAGLFRGRAARAQKKPRPCRASPSSHLRL